MTLPTNCRAAQVAPTSLRFASNEDGATAIEFAILALPFFMFVFAIIGYGLYFLTSTYLEHGVETAARKIRTGEVATGGANGKAMTVGEFRTLVCNSSKPVIDCSKMRVHVQHGENWSNISPQACLNATGSMNNSSGQTGESLANYAGGASEVVLVTVCYQWDLATTFGFLKLGSNGGSGPAIIQAATAFKSEPYN